MEEKVNIFMLPTLETTDIFMSVDLSLMYTPEMNEKINGKYQHLYAISDGEINLNDTFVAFNENGEPTEIQTCNKYNFEFARTNGKLLVGTTDYLMFGGSVGQFSKEAIKDYIEKYNDSDTNKLNKEQYLRMRGVLPENDYGVIYYFQSNRDGVSEILELPIFEIHENSGRRMSGRGSFVGTRYVFNKEPFEVTLFGDKDVEAINGIATGTGDLWYSSKFFSKDKEAIVKAREEELMRVEEKYG